FNNVAESIVHSGVQINQDPYYHPDDGDGLPHSPNANNDNRHVVSIEATNYMQFMNLTGTFGFTLPKVSVGVPDPSQTVDIASKVLKLRNKDFSDIKEAFEKPAPGATGGKGGVGGAIFLQFLNNSTQAVVEKNVNLYSGVDSGLNIKAEEAIFDLGFSQAG